MTRSDAIFDELPDTRPDEPPHLRDDIADELNDHLASAMRRELLKDHDEPAATRRMLARFGNPARIARQLYLAAMKEQIMKDRITIGLMAVMAVTCAGMLWVVWMVSSRAEASQQAFMAQLVAMNEKLNMQQDVFPEWGSLIIELTDEHGRPVPNQEFQINGRPYNEDRQQELTFRTDADGRIILDPIRAADSYTMWTKVQEGWQYINNHLFLKPGENHVLKLQYPEQPPAADALPSVKMPNENDVLLLPLRCTFIRQRENLADGSYWNPLSGVYIVELDRGGGAVKMSRLDPATGDTIRIERNRNDSWSLPTGMYRWEQFNTLPGINDSKLHSISLKRSTFQIESGKMNLIAIPLDIKPAEPPAVD